MFSARGNLLAIAIVFFIAYGLCSFIFDLFYLLGK